MAGRPPKPTALKLLQGNPGKRKLNQDEPKPPVGAEMPAYLLVLPAAVRQWNLWAPKLTAAGILTEIDANAFARLCRLWAEDEERAVTGLPADDRRLAELRQLEGRFACDPSSRSKVHAEPKKPETRLGKFAHAAKG